MSQAATAGSPRRALASASAPGARSAIAAWGVAAFALALLYATRAAQQTGDSLLYAYSAKSGQDLFHPHHLLYTPAVWFIGAVLAPFCARCDAVLAGQLHNIAWAGVTVALFYLSLHRLTGHVGLSLIGAGWLLFTRGMWELATQTTVYVPAVGALALLTVALLLRPTGALSRRAALVLAGLLALAVLYHQANLLFCLPLTYYLISRTGPRGWRLAGAVVGLAGVIVLAGYVAAFLTTGAPWSLAHFVRFCLSYTTQVCSGGQCDASPSQWGDLRNLGTGLGTALNSLVWNYFFVPSRLRLVVEAVVGLGLLSLVLWHVWQSVRGARWRAFRVFLLLWLLGYGLFFWWWLPDYQHPFLLTVFPTLLLAYLAIEDLRGRLGTAHSRRMVLLGANAGLVLVLGGVNFAGSILPLYTSRGDTYLEAAELSQAAPRSCTVLASFRVWNHLRYYFDRTDGTRQGKYPLSYFHRRLSLPAAYAIPEGACVVIDTHLVTPDFVVSGYTPAPVDGYTQPDEWLAYVAWLFRFNYGGNQGVTAARSFEVIRLDEGGPYLSLAAEITPVAGLADLFTRLDTALSEAAAPEAGIFTDWLAETHTRP